MLKRALILANGDPPSPALAQRIAREADIRIVADGAVHKAVPLGIAPDILCGDFDSVDMEAARRSFPSVAVVPTPDQDFADLEKAILVALQRGAMEAAILGALGGRMDHTLSSFALLSRYAGMLSLRLLDDRGATWVIRGKERQSFAASPGDTVSLITFTGADVSITGVEWPLDRFMLDPGTHGVSNVAAQTEVTVRVDMGTVFITHLSALPQAFVY